MADNYVKVQYKCQININSHVIMLMEYIIIAKNEWKSETIKMRLPITQNLSTCLHPYKMGMVS